MLDFDPYEVLQVPHSASVDEIKKARKRLALLHHPDKFNNDKSKENVMKLLNQACDILCDPEKKRRFNEKAEKGKDEKDEFKHSKAAFKLEKLTGYALRSKQFEELIEAWKKDGLKKKYKVRDKPKPYSSYINEIQNELEKHTTDREFYFDYDLNSINESIQDVLFVNDDLDERLSGLSMFDKDSFKKLILSNRIYEMQSRKSVMRNSNNEYPIIDLNIASVETLKNLLFGLNYKKYLKLKTTSNRRILIEELMQVVPLCKAEKVVTKEKPQRCKNCNRAKPGGLLNVFKTFLEACKFCGDCFCENCLRQSCRIPRLEFQADRLCLNCINTNDEWEIDAWLSYAAGCLAKGKIVQGLNLFRLALNFENTKHKIIEMMLRKLDNKPLLLVPLLFDILSLTHINEKQYEAYLILLSQNIWKIADSQTNLDKKYKIYNAAVKSYLMIKNNKLIESEFNSLILTKRELVGTINRTNMQATNKTIENEIVSLVNSSDLKCIIDYMTRRKEVSELFALRVFFENATEDNYQEPSKSNFLLLRGLYLLFQEESFKSKVLGYQDIERAFWNGWNFWIGWETGFVNILLEAMEKNCLMLVDFILFDKSLVDDLLPKRDDLKPIKKRMWPQMCLKSKSLKPLKCYEEAINYNFEKGLMNWDHVKSVLSYIDLIDGCTSVNEIVFCYLHAASWALDGMDASENPIEKYYLSRIVYKCIEDAVMIAHGFLDTVCKSVIFRFAFGAAHFANIFDLEEDKTVEIKYLKLYLFGACILPVHYIPLVQVSESVLLSIALKELSSTFFENLRTIEDSKKPIKENLIDYMHFENFQYGIIEKSEDEEEDLKVSVMQSFLNNHGISWKNVTNYLNYRLIERDKNGWLVNKPELNFNKYDGGFNRFNGFILNKKTNDIQILADKEPIWTAINLQLNKSALISWEDIATVFYNFEETEISYFSLDPIDENIHLHPFQCFDYKPKCMKESMFLHTLFHTDYLLKQFAMGVEVSSLPPFKQRKASKEGLYKDLSDEMVKILKPIHERGKTYFKSRRLWIQADELDYSINENENELKVLFGDLKMSVRTQPMFYNSEGKLVDLSEKSDEKSPEQQFCKDFTDNYDKIGEKFREFARLKELCKLQYLGVFLKAYKTSLIEYEKKLMDEEKINRIYDESVKKCRTHFDDALDELRKNVRSKLTSIDSDVIEQICKALGLSTYSYKYNVRSWLDYNDFSSKYELVEALVSSKGPKLSEIRDQIKRLAEKDKIDFTYKIGLVKSSLKPIVNMIPENWPSQNEWVPALFNKYGDDYNFIYGGVVLAPKLVDCNLNNISTGKYTVTQQQNVIQNLRKEVDHRASKNSTSNQIQQPFVQKQALFTGKFKLFKAENNINIATEARRYASTLINMFSSRLKDEAQKKEFRRIFLEQLSILFDQIRNNPNFVTAETYKDARKNFDRDRKKLKAIWEEKYGLNLDEIFGNVKYEIHHIIPVQYGGNNEWYNLIPLPKDLHQLIHHGKETRSRELEKYMESVRDLLYPNYKTKRN